LVQNTRPTYNQREVYNGKDRVHGLKYQSLTFPNGLIGNLYGPVEGRLHDATLLRESGILQEVANFTDVDGRPLVIYGDKAYPLSDQLLTPYRGVGHNNDQRNFNLDMNSARISVEWNFAGVNNNFAFMNYSPNLKLYLQPIAVYYKVSVILSNCRTCLYGNQTSKYFELDPPTIQEYLQ